MHAVRFFILPFIPLMFVDYLSNESKIKLFLNSNIIQFFGDISFPLYLIHSSILVIGFQFPSGNVILSVAGATCVAFTVSYAYCVFIDQPLYRYLKSIIKRQNKKSTESCTIWVFGSSIFGICNEHGKRIISKVKYKEIYYST